MSLQSTKEPAIAYAMSRLLAWAVVVAVVVRSVTWLLTFGLVNPVTGVVLTVVDARRDWDWRVPVVIEVGLIMVAVIVSVTAAIGARRDWAHYQRRVRILGGIIAVHTMLYLVPFVAVLFFDSGIPAWALLTVILANVPLVVLGVRIWRHARPDQNWSSSTS